MNLMQLGWRALTQDKAFVKALLGDIAGMSKLHLELFMAEARVEGLRLKRKIFLLAAATISISLAVLFFFIAIMVAAWDTPYRLYALFGMPVFLAVTGGILYAVSSAQKPTHAAFERTTAELKKDAQWLIEIL